MSLFKQIWKSNIKNQNKQLLFHKCSGLFNPLQFFMFLIFVKIFQEIWRVFFNIQHRNRGSGTVKSFAGSVGSGSHGTERHHASSSFLTRKLKSSFNSGRVQRHFSNLKIKTYSQPVTATCSCFTLHIFSAHCLSSEPAMSQLLFCQTKQAHL